MSEYYSTQTTVGLLISTSRLAGFTDPDKDGTPNTDILEYGFKAARSLIRAYLKRDYNTDTIDAWTDSTCPDFVGFLSDCLCARLFYQKNPRFQEAANSMYDEAVQMLKDIRNGDLDIYGIDRDVTHLDDLIETGSIDSDFDPERELDDMTVRTTWVNPDARDLENY
jgi:hypothetical protein